MPPRRSARLVELANPHFQLPFPPNVVALLFSLLPLDARLRAREVCRGWRFLLEDVRFWTHVDLSASCGVNPRFLTSERLGLALLRAACVRAQGSLQSVDLSGVEEEWEDDPVVPFERRRWLDSATAADKASLRDLVAPLCYPSLNLEQATALCRALPLCRVRCDVECNAVEALPLLRREPPFALLTINKLVVLDNVGDEAVLNLASALTGYNGMEKLEIIRVPLATRAVLDALVDAAISAGIKYICFIICHLSPTALPALGRLLQSPGFEHLGVHNDNLTLLEGPALPAFCEALRICTSLRKLELYFVHLWDDMAVATQLIAALEGLPALQKLSTETNSTDGTPAAQQIIGECLARLIAHSSSLRALHLCGPALGEAGLAPIFEAFHSHSSLVELEIFNAGISANFARNVVLPAVHINTCLRKLEGFWLVDAVEDWDEEELPPELREEKDILAARRRADEEATL